MGRAGYGPRGEIRGGDPQALLPGHSADARRRTLARVGTGALFGAAAWIIAFLVWSSEPAGYDFIALYASARLVATGAGSAITDPAALLAMESATLPERTILLNNPNLPALALLMAPLGTLPLAWAFGIWSALGAAALAGAAAFLGRLADPAQRGRLLPFALLAPTSLIALAEGQTTPFVLLAVAASLRAPPLWSGALLGLAVFRPQVFPLLALVALTDRRRAVGMVTVVAAVALASFATVGAEGMARYPALLSAAATELRPGELGIAALVRRVAGGEDLALNAALGAVILLVAAVAVLARSRMTTSRLVDASTWSILAAPHALLHDGVMAYPGVARAASTTVTTAVWVGSGIAVALLHQAGIPVAAFWLLALWASGAISRSSGARSTSSGA